MQARTYRVRIFLAVVRTFGTAKSDPDKPRRVKELFDLRPPPIQRPDLRRPIYKTTAPTSTSCDPTCFTWERRSADDSGASLLTSPRTSSSSSCRVARRHDVRYLVPVPLAGACRSARSCVCRSEDDTSVLRLGDPRRRRGVLSEIASLVSPSP